MAELKHLQQQLQGGLASHPTEQRRIDFHRATRPETSYNVQKPKKKKKGGADAATALNDDLLVLPQGRQSIYPEGRVERLCLWATEAAIGRGFSNLGNTCYLNSVLQCLTYSPPFAQFMLMAEPSAKCTRVPGICFVKLLEQHIRGSQSRSSGGAQQKQKRGGWGGGSGGALAPTAIVKNLRVVGKQFRVGRQEDAHEFLCHLLQAVQKRLLKGAGVAELGSGRRPETTALHRVYGGYLRSQIRCTDNGCGRASSTYDAFLDLSLELKNSTKTVKAALASFTKAETLDRDNRWRCPGCNKLVCAEKRFTIHAAPPMLIIHLKRFAWGFRAGGKLMKHVGFAEKLDLHRFSSESVAQPPGRGDRGAVENDGAWTYSLAGVVVHHGSGMGGGHYTAFVKSSAGVWYHMDDSSVRQVTLQAVLQQQAYLLFYVKTARAAKIASERAKARAGFGGASGTGEQATAKERSRLEGGEMEEQRRRATAEQAVERAQVAAMYAAPRRMMGPELPPARAQVAAVATAAVSAHIHSGRSMEPADVAKRAKRAMQRTGYQPSVPVVGGSLGACAIHECAVWFGRDAAAAAAAMAQVKSRRQQAAEAAAANQAATLPQASNGAVERQLGGAVGCGRGVNSSMQKIIRKDQDARVVSVGLTKAGGRMRGFGWKASKGDGAGVFDGGGVQQWGDEEKYAATAAAMASSTERAEQRVRGPNGDWQLVNPGASKGAGAAAAAAGLAAAAAASGVDPQQQKLHNRLLRQARKEDERRLKKRTQDEWDLSLDRGKTKRVKKDRDSGVPEERFQKDNNRFAVAQVQAAEYVKKKRENDQLYNDGGIGRAPRKEEAESQAELQYDGRAATPAFNFNDNGDDMKDW